MPFVQHFVRDRALTRRLSASFHSGEASVKALMHRFPWVKHPMVTRLVALPPEVGLTFIYGAHSFMGRKPAFAIRDARTQSFVQVHVRDHA